MTLARLADDNEDVALVAAELHLEEAGEFDILEHPAAGMMEHFEVERP